MKLLAVLRTLLRRTRKTTRKASTCTMKYCTLYIDEASVLCMFLTLDIRGMITLISMRNFVELQGIREQSVIFYLQCMNHYHILAYFSMLKPFYYIFVYGARWLLIPDGDRLILLDVMKLGFSTWFSLSLQPFSQAHPCSHFSLQRGMPHEKLIVSKLVKILVALVFRRTPSFSVNTGWNTRNGRFRFL